MEKITMYMVFGILTVLVLVLASGCGCGDSAFRWVILGVLMVNALVVCSSGSEASPPGGTITGGATPKSEKLSIFDPRFNMREIAKHLLLLEDHLFHENKHCIDCISKHFLTIEAFAEETLTLDKEMKYGEEVKHVLRVKEIMPPLIEKMKEKKANLQDYAEAAQALRVIRKPIAVKYGYLK